MIPPFNLNPLHNGEYITFTGNVLRITGIPEVPASVRALHGQLNAFHERIQAQHVSEDESELTSERRAFDADRDRHFSSLYQLADLYTRHPAAEKAAAGRRLTARFADYGTITEIIEQGIDDESADIDSILRDLEAPELAAAVRLIGGDDWVAALKTAQAGVKEKSAERNAERSERQAQLPEDIDTLRKKANKAYRNLIDKINAYNNTDEGAEPWPGIIQKMNTLIVDTRQVLAARRGRAAAGKAPQA